MRYRITIDIDTLDSRQTVNEVSMATAEYLIKRLIDRSAKLEYVTTERLTHVDRQSVHRAITGDIASMKE